MKGDLAATVLVHQFEQRVHVLGVVADVQVRQQAIDLRRRHVLERVRPGAALRRRRRSSEAEQQQRVRTTDARRVW